MGNSLCNQIGKGHPTALKSETLDFNTIKIPHPRIFNDRESIFSDFQIIEKA